MDGQVAVEFGMVAKLQLRLLHFVIERLCLSAHLQTPYAFHALVGGGSAVKFVLGGA